MTVLGVIGVAAIALAICAGLLILANNEMGPSWHDVYGGDE